MANWVEKNGYWFDIDYNRDLEDYLHECGVDAQEVADSYMDLDAISDDIYDKIGADYVKHQDGMVGDDYYIFVEELERILEDLKTEVLEPLGGDGRKKENQRAAIYKNVEQIVRNFETLIH